jgi:16S rRNA (cytosine967-C5)-methyltransferase
MVRNTDETTPEATGWQSRLAAAELVLAATDRGVDFEAAMYASRSFGRLEGSDRGFARAMASMTLRGLGRIDWALGGMVERPLSDIEPPLRALLRVGAAQLWLMDVARHAAVSSTLEAARKWDIARRGGGLVNAVLRRASREGEIFADAPATSVWPDWLAARMKAALGAPMADVMALAQLEEPPVDLTLRSPDQTDMWAEQLGAVVMPNGSLRLPAATGLSEMPGFAEGAWWVQDTAAALPARLLGDVRGQAVADLCAAPGGKAMQLAAMGAKLFAIDISKQRTARLRENAERSMLEMEIIEADARTWRPAEPLDAVLLDAPCSALGVMRRHPEGVWRRDPKDLARLPSIQRALVDAAQAMLKPGGRLVYAVCTPLPEEGRDVIDAAVAAGGWRRAEVMAAEAPGFETSLTPEGDVLTLPHAGPHSGADAAPGPDQAMNPDAFFIARLERI